MPIHDMVRQLTVKGRVFLAICRSNPKASCMFFSLIDMS